MDMLATRKELATISGYTYRRLYDIDKSLPDDQKLFVEKEGGKCDVSLFVQRWVAYQKQQEAGDDKSLDEVKAIHEKVKTRKTELEVKKMEGALVSVDDVRKLWGDVANVVTQNMIHLASKIAPMVVMMSSVEKIAAIIDREVRDILTLISETPVPENAAQIADKEEGQEENEEV